MVITQMKMLKFLADEVQFVKRSASETTEVRLVPRLLFSNDLHDKGVEKCFISRTTFQRCYFNSTRGLELSNSELNALFPAQQPFHHYGIKFT